MSLSFFRYCAHISAATHTGETATGAAITNAFAKLLRVFAERNGGALPYNIIVYRGGVADNHCSNAGSRLAKVDWRASCAAVRAARRFSNSGT